MLIISILFFLLPNFIFLLPKPFSYLIFVYFFLLIPFFKSRVNFLKYVGNDYDSKKYRIFFKTFFGQFNTTNFKLSIKLFVFLFITVFCLFTIANIFPIVVHTQSVFLVISSFFFPIAVGTLQTLAFFNDNSFRVSLARTIDLFKQHPTIYIGVSIMFLVQGSFFTILQNVPLVHQQVNLILASILNTLIIYYQEKKLVQHYLSLPDRQLN